MSSKLLKLAGAFFDFLFSSVKALVATMLFFAGVLLLTKLSVASVSGALALGLIGLYMARGANTKLNKALGAVKEVFRPSPKAE